VQTISLRRPEFEWRASTGPFGCISVLDAMRGGGADLEVRAFGLLRIARLMRGGAVAAKGEREIRPPRFVRQALRTARLPRCPIRVDIPMKSLMRIMGHTDRRRPPGAARDLAAGERGGGHSSKGVIAIAVMCVSALFVAHDRSRSPLSTKYKGDRLGDHGA
jgi:hypothetical protein